MASKAKTEKNISNIKDQILEVYDIIDPTKDKKLLTEVKLKLDIPEPELRKKLADKTIKFNYMIPPFNGPDFAAIKEAASILGIELDERVWISSMGMWSKVKVPVGKAYYSQINTPVCLYSDI